MKFFEAIPLKNFHRIFFILSIGSLLLLPFETDKWRYFFTAMIMLFLGLICLGFTKK
jgi:hypothetical protein